MSTNDKALVESKHESGDVPAKAQSPDPVLPASLRLPIIAGRIASLDGLRAVSICIVLGIHLTGTRNFPVPAHGSIGDFGDHCMKIFFLMSAFLITSLLLGEAAKHGRISLYRFYVRRVFRIFPALYAFALVVFVLDVTDVIDLNPSDMLSTLTHTVNYNRDTSWYIGHLWSLSVEEQFYIVWPAVMLIAGARRSIQAAAIIMVLAPLSRLFMGMYPSLHEGIDVTFPGVADAFATGCVLAGLRPWMARSERLDRFFKSSAFIIVPIISFAAAFNPSTKLDWLIGQSVMNIGIALMLERCLRLPNDWFGRILNTRLMVFIGTLSYSLYVWQQLFLNRSSAGILQSFPFNIIAVGVVALASFYVVELPFMRFRVLLEKRISNWTKRRAASQLGPAVVSPQPVPVEAESRTAA